MRFKLKGAFSRETLNWTLLPRGLAVLVGIALVTGALWYVQAQSVSEVVDVQPEVNLDKDATPMAQRVATIGFLNKRNGLTRDFQMKPGQNFLVSDGVIIRLRACETTAPWEADPYTGAFVQLDVENAERQWQRVFSGWMYKESPGLNAVEHPVYDVWVKACQMSHGEPPPTAPKSPNSAAQSSNTANDASPDAGDTAADNSAQ
jgi:hypothetical protein